jgi:class 3 adenylate cyclase
MRRADLKQLFSAASIAVVATAISLFIVKSMGVLAHMETITEDIRVAALQAPMPQSKEIVVIGINEETLSRFPYRSPIDRAFIADLLAKLEKKGPLAIGLDVLLDQATEPEKDRLLAKTIREIKTPLFVSYSNTPGIVTEDQLAYLNDFVPANLRAGANLAFDPFDSAVRWIFPGENVPGMPLGFARKAMEAAGKPVPPREQPEIAWRTVSDLETPPFPIYPAHAVAALPKAWFENKILLVGATLSITDKHRTPLAVVFDDERGMMPGIVVMAHAVSQFVEGASVRRLPLSGQVAMVLLVSLVGVAVGLAKKGIGFNVTVGAILVLLVWFFGVWGYGRGLPLVPLIAPTLSLALSLWMMDMLIGKAERKQRQFVQGAFSRYVSPTVVAQLVNDPEALSIKGKRQEATFIFTDIAGFTTLSELLPSDQLSDVLNDYLNGACAIVQANEGTIDKFIGDAIMAIFNAPIAQPDHQARAVKCALELDAYCEKFRIENNKKGIPIGVTRIGVHSGLATIGNFGSQSRMDFTAVGDTVNAAARTEGVNKYFGTRICCTDTIVPKCPGMNFRVIGDVILKGKETPVTLYNPITAEEAKSELGTGYLAAYQLLEACNPLAIEKLKVLEQRFPEDPLIKFHLSRIEKGLLTTLIKMEDK